MLRPITTSTASVGGAPSAVRASTAAHLSPHDSRAATIGAAESAQGQTAIANAEQMFRYNSFEFIYRQDIGRIVLVGQSPETGERVVQVPSEQALRAYERTVRVERQRAQTEGGGRSAPQQVAPTPAPQLAKALVAAVSGENHGSGVFSVSA
jgi:hypothetical protein